MYPISLFKHLLGFRLYSSLSFPIIFPTSPLEIAVMRGFTHFVRASLRDPISSAVL